MKDNVLLDKSFKSAIRVVNLYRCLCNDKNEFILSRQLLRCDTSIGANINEAQEVQSINDFISKLSISFLNSQLKKCWIFVGY